jgi:hypothetical protein
MEHRSPDKVSYVTAAGVSKRLQGVPESGIETKEEKTGVLVLEGGPEH